MATEQSITISGTPTVVTGVTVPFIETDASELEVYVSQGKIESIEVVNKGAGYTNRARAAAEKLIFSGGEGTAPDLWITVGQDPNNSGRIDGSIYGHATSGAELVNTNLSVGSGYTTPPNISLTNLDGGEGGQLTAKIFAKKTLVTDYSISGTSGNATITFTSPLTNGDIVKIKRVTNVASPANTFQSGSSITARALNDSFNQIRHRVEELPDLLTTSLVDGDKGDITVSGNTWTIDNDAITGTKIANPLTINDGRSIKWGTGGDLEIVHDATTGNSIIKHTGTGNLYLQAPDSDALIISSPDASNTAATFDPNGSVALNYGAGNSQRLATTSAGVSVTGSVTSSTLTDNRVLLAGTAGLIEDSGNLTFDGTTLVVTGSTNIDNITIDDKTISTSGGDITIDPSTGILNITNPGGLASIEVGKSATTDQNAFIDLIGDSTYNDYGARIIRYGGANSDTYIAHRGTGSLKLIPEDTNGQDANDNQGDVQLFYSNALRFQTFKNGTYTTGTHSESGSDIRLKENIVNITGAVSKVKQLQGFNYNFNSVGQGLGFSNKLDVGLSAQDVEKVSPEVVSKIPDTDYLTIKYEKLVPLLIESIKELSTEVETLKTKVAALEAK